MKNLVETTETSQNIDQFPFVPLVPSFRTISDQHPLQIQIHHIKNSHIIIIIDIGLCTFLLVYQENIHLKNPTRDIDI